MRSYEKRPKRPVFALSSLIFGAVLLVLPLIAPGAAEARVRIETGADLRAACAVLAEHHLNPKSPAPREALFCRQYLMGYFGSLAYLHEDERLKRAFNTPSQNTVACINIDGARSYDQLAQQIVRTADWNPQLMEEPAVKLAQKTFSDRPPC
ncbi:MAG: hypothetical protein CVT72_02480 [Alphaproteobacteria bacterium HGW-Alphaproteobacteria-11]|nr:MAG: hypothetical protein CVT72_02480 [Alphaproteobacteria bacterium HGW-Alphaproteobacteria-11]